MYRKHRPVRKTESRVNEKLFNLNYCNISFLITDKKEGLIFKKGGTEIGKGLAEKSKGLFSADDWQCKR